MKRKRACALIGLGMFLFANVFVLYSFMNLEWSLPLPDDVTNTIYAGYIIVMIICLYIALRKKGQ
jgi:pilus assembly protein TadC